MDKLKSETKRIKSILSSNTIHQHHYFKLKQLTHDLVMVSESNTDPRMLGLMAQLMDYIHYVSNIVPAKPSEAPALALINRDHLTLLSHIKNAPKRV